MMTNLKYWLKGLAVAAASMIIYAVALGCYMALMLLVISMEEGGDNLSAFSVPLTEALVLLSQGIGFKTDAITLTIVPLLLTVLLIALIAQLARRFGTSLRGFAAGLVFWEAVNIFFARSINIEIVDSMTMIAIKTALVFILGYAVAAIPNASWTQACTEWIRSHVSSPVRKTMVIGSVLGLLLEAAYPEAVAQSRPDLHTKLGVPGFKDLFIPLGFLYVLFVVLVVVSMSNGVNLTDGLDGLAAGVSVISIMTYAAIAYIVSRADWSHYLFLTYVPEASELFVFGGALLGAGLGFLWFNSHPAEVFMGDTGSLSLGGAIAALALLTKQELLLPIVAGMFALEALSAGVAF